MGKSIRNYYQKHVKEAKPCDFVILALTAALVIFGIVMIFSASYYYAMNRGSSPYYYLIRQSIWAVIGTILMFGFSYIDYHLIQRFSWLILIVSVLLLLALFTPIGFTINGATRWIRFGPISIMPGEIAKFAMICFVAAFYSKDDGKARKFFRGDMPMFLLTAAVAGLIVLQPNLSTAITLAAIVVGMMYVAGMHFGVVVALIGALAGGIVAIANSGFYWATRISSFLDPFADPSGSSYQVVQSLLALGTGGLSGLGLGKSVQKTLYLPEPMNDFILAITGEELGLIGIFLLLIVFVVLVWRGMMLAMRAPDRFGMLFTAGTMLMIGIQVVLNIAVVTSSMPATGVALPFISYGGNSLWIFMASIGIVLNVSRQAEHTEPAAKTKRAGAGPRDFLTRKRGAGRRKGAKA